MRYIRVRMLANDILMSLGETYARVHSDEELVRAINHVASYVNLTLVRMESPYVQKEIKVPAKKRGVELPDDFLQVSHFGSDEDRDLTDGRDKDESRHNRYRLRGDKVYTSHDDVMVYYYHVRPIMTLNDILELPYFFYLMLVRLIVGYINGTITDDGIASTVAKEIEGLMADTVVIDRDLPFYV